MWNDIYEFIQPRMTSLTEALMIFVLMNIISCFSTNFKKRQIHLKVYIHFFLNNPFYNCHLMKLFMFEIVLVTIANN